MVPGQRASRDESLTAERRTALAVGLAVLLTHGLMLLMDGVYWDGWLYSMAVTEGSWERLLAGLAPAGVPQYAVVYWILGSLPWATFTRRLVVLLLLMGTSLSILRIARLNGLGRRESAVMAILFAIFPTHWLAMAVNMSAYYLWQFLFFLAAWLHFRWSPRPAAGGWLKRATVATLFMISFSLASLLVLFGTFFLLAVATDADGRPTASRLWNAFLRRFELVLAPVLFWLIKLAFLEPYGLYTQYNRIALIPYRLYRQHLHFAEFLLDLARRVLTLPLQEPFLAVVAVGAVVGVLAMVRPREPEEYRSTRASVLLGIFSVFVLVAAIFPYAAVGKVPELGTWNERQAMLLPVPWALGLTAVLFAFPRSKPLVRWGTLGALGFIMASCVTTIWSTHLSFQARWAKDRAVIEQLARNPDWSRYHSYVIEDASTSWAQPEYRFYDWSSIFHVAWGGESRIGVVLPRDADVREELAELVRFASAHYYLADWTPGGPVAELRIEPGPANSWSARRVARTYWTQRLLGREQDLLRSLVTVSVEPREP